MTLKTIAGHTFDLDRLPPRATVLDVGCRGFDFTGGIRELRPQALIYALDPDTNIQSPPECCFLHLALVGTGRRTQRYARYSTGEGNFLMPDEMKGYYDAEVIEVACVDIREITELLPPAYSIWDLVKLDCEGSEFDVLQNWPGPVANQISVEWHDYDRRHLYPPAYYERLFAKLGGMGYRVIQHELSDISGRGAIGHWDSLLVLDC